MNIINISGTIKTELSDDEWLDDFVEWLESRDEFFGGAIHIEQES